MKLVDRQRADGRRALLLYLRPELIKRLKVMALDVDRHAYELAEEALSSWFANQHKGRKRKK
jgi:hypothetical protein